MSSTTAAGALLRPRRAGNVELVGEVQQSGFVDRQWLVQRDDRFVQLTELLYRTCEYADGERTVDEIAAALSDVTPRTVTGDQVRYLVDAKLAPQGLVSFGDGAVPDTSTAPPAARDTTSPLRLNMRTTVIGPRVIDPITRVLQHLFAPAILVPMLLAVVIGQGWMFAAHGSAVLEGLRGIIYAPVTMLAVFGVLLVAGVIHEFGHAAALRYGGGRSRGMGVGFYLVYPAIYTDTSDAYRLGRWARVRTDLGGFYFYLISTLVLLGLYLVTGQPFLLVAILLIDADILYQSLPFVRFDGYWALADLTGIPDLFVYMKPFLRSLVPGSAAGGDRLPQLRPWVRRVFLSYVLLTVPVLATLLIVFMTRVPSVLAMVWDSYLQQGSALSAAIDARDLAPGVLALIQIVFLAILVLGIGYMLFTVGRMLLNGARALVRGARRREPRVA